MGIDKNDEDDIARQRFRETLEKALSPPGENNTIAEAREIGEDNCNIIAAIAFQQFYSLTKAGFYRNEAVSIVASMMNGVLTDCFE